MAGRIPQTFIDDLLLRTDIVDVIDSRVPLKKMGKNYGACCPFHEEKTPSFTVSPDKQFYHCFGCGAHGTAIGFLMDYERMEFRDAVEELATRAGLQLPTGGREAQVDPAVAAAADVLGAADRYYRNALRNHPDAQRAVDYLKGRGLSGRIAADFGLGFAPDGWDNLLREVGTDNTARAALEKAGMLVKKEGGSYYDRFRNRIMFPILDHRGRLVGVGGRVLGDGEPKYLNSPETALFHKGRELYGLYQGRDAIRERGRALVVEGYMDVVALTQFGIRNAVATLGTATTPQHLERIFRHCPEVVFCFDGDRAGREAAWRALQNALPVLQDGRQVSFLFLPEGEDPDTLVRKEGAEAFEARIGKAQSLPDFLFDRLGDQVDLDRLDGRARLVELARPLLNSLPAGTLRELMYEQLARLARTDAATLRPAPPAAAAAAPRRTPDSGQHRDSASLVRQAISLLLQQPTLAAQVADPRALSSLDLAGLPLLVDLLEQAQRQPGLSTAALVEHYRDDPRHRHLEKLAAEQHMVDGEGLAREFDDAILRLHTALVEQTLGRLLEKADRQQITDEERNQINELYKRQREYQALLARQ